MHVCVRPPLFPSLLLSVTPSKESRHPVSPLGFGVEAGCRCSRLYLLRQTRTTSDAQDQKKQKKTKPTLRGYGVQHPLPLRTISYHVSPGFFRSRTSNPCSQHRLQSQHGEGGADPQSPGHTWTVRQVRLCCFRHPLRRAGGSDRSLRRAVGPLARSRADNAPLSNSICLEGGDLTRNIMVSKGRGRERA